MNSTLRYRLLTLVAGAAAFSFGAFACVIGTGEIDDLGDPCTPVGSNAHLNSSGACVCDTFYEWCDPSQQNGAHQCCEKDSRPAAGEVDGPCESGSNNIISEKQECLCLEGYDWCSSDENDLNCCIDTSTSTATDSNSTGSDSSSSNTETGIEPPENCDASVADTWCTNSKAMGPEGSKYYACENGKWIDRTIELDTFCVQDGADFAYGCHNEPEGPTLDCGEGSGKPCTTGSADWCSDDKEGVLSCVAGRETYTSCIPCEVEGMEYPYGVCDLQDGIYGCLCSDEDPNETTGTGESTETADTGDTTATSESETTATEENDSASTD